MPYRSQYRAGMHDLLMFAASSPRGAPVGTLTKVSTKSRAMHSCTNPSYASQLICRLRVLPTAAVVRNAASLHTGACAEFLGYTRAHIPFSSSARAHTSSCSYLIAVQVSSEHLHTRCLLALTHSQLVSISKTLFAALEAVTFADISCTPLSTCSVGRLISDESCVWMLRLSWLSLYDS